VLVDSERLAVGVGAAVLARLGWPLNESEIVALTPGARLEAEGAVVFDDMRDLPQLLARLR
jgi:hypothetical protein